jgi:hypothetical protein
MSYNGKIRHEALVEGQQIELSRFLVSLVEIKPELRDRYAAKLVSAPSLEELRRLEKPLIRDFTA